MDKPRNRNWIWYFVVLVVLGVAAAAIPLFYNQYQQLTLPVLQAARERWEQQGPKNYIMEYFKEGNSDGFFVVTVRDGKAVSVIAKSKPDDPGRPLEARQLGHYDMFGIMDDIERFLEMDAQPGAPAVFNQATFAENGQLLRYRRRVPATNFSQRITVQRLEVLPD
jgi:hypothetical protein